MKDVVKACLGELIVSCQAYEDTPMYGSDNIKRFVESAKMGGAKVVRCCWKQDIEAARTVEGMIIIGINKAMNAAGSADDIFITPTFESAKEVIDAGADIIALDTRITAKRSKDDLFALLRSIREAYPSVGIMADCSCYEEGKLVADAGLVDIVSTTLSGLAHPMVGPDYNLVRRFKENLSVPVNAEGRIWEAHDLELVVAAGADMITIGTAITRPHDITKRFIDIYDHLKVGL